MNPIVTYESVEVSHPYRLVGPGNAQTDLGLIWRPPSYRSPGQNVTAPSQLRIPGVGLGYFSMHVRNAVSTGVYGLGVRIPNYLWRAGTTATGSPDAYTDDTVDAQDAGTADFPLETTTNNDGHMIFSQVPFNAVSYDIDTASVAGAGYAHDISYSDEEGDAWVVMAANAIWVNSFGTAAIPLTGTTVANEALIVFDVPSRWGRSDAIGSLASGGAPIGYYGLRVRATDAPDTAAVAGVVGLYRLFFLTEAVADNGTLSQDFGSKDFLMATDPSTGQVYGDAIVALFSTADEGNRITLQVRGR